MFEKANNFMPFHLVDQLRIGVFFLISKSNEIKSTSPTTAE
jgi:hypothetical protein